MKKRTSSQITSDIKFNVMTIMGHFAFLKKNVKDLAKGTVTNILSIEHLEERICALENKTSKGDEPCNDSLPPASS